MKLVLIYQESLLLCKKGFFSRSQSPTGNATERLCLRNLVSMKAEPSVIHSHTEYGNENIFVIKSLEININLCLINLFFDPTQ